MQNGGGVRDWSTLGSVQRVASISEHTECRCAVHCYTGPSRTATPGRLPIPPNLNFPPARPPCQFVPTTLDTGTEDDLQDESGRLTQVLGVAAG